MEHHPLSGLPDPNKDHQFYDGVCFKRLLAWCIDVIIVALLTLGMIVLTLGTGIFIFFILFLIVNIGYRIFTLMRNSATAGMYITGIEIRNGHGDKLSTPQATAHTLLYIIFAASVFPLILSCAMMMFSRYGQGIHDFILHTTMINRPHRTL